MEGAKRSSSGSVGQWVSGSVGQWKVPIDVCRILYAAHHDGYSNFYTAYVLIYVLIIKAFEVIAHDLYTAVALKKWQQARREV